MSDLSNEHKFPALSSSSLLGFMAALGAFYTLNGRPEYKGCRLIWIPQGSSHYPTLRTPGKVDSETLLEHLHESLTSQTAHEVLTFEKNLKVNQNVFRTLCGRMADEFLKSHDQFGCSMLAAFGSDAIINDEGMIEDTAFRTMGGAGHQHFLAFMNELAKSTTLDHLREALVGPWRYRDPSPTMRWDESDDRRYALRWEEPSKDPVRTVRGANRLAVAALPLFPTYPSTNGILATTAFKGGKSNNTFITWPVWTGWLTLDAVKSVLSLNELQESEPSHEKLRTLGIVTTFRSQRITLGKFRNFTPAKII